MQQRQTATVCCVVHLLLVVTQAILQGERTKYAPWQARLLTDVHDPNSGYCGGILIDSSHVLTALHCVCSDPEYNSLSHTMNCTNIRTDVGIVLGDNIISQEEGSEVYAMCNEIALHPRGFNMAICELDRNVSSTPAIQPIKLPYEEPLVGATVKATGWGSTDRCIRDIMANRLYEVTLRITNSLFAHELCAEGIDPLSQHRQGIWYGDGGGPLVLSQSGSWYLVGVASAARGGSTISACNSLFINVYTQKEWIQSITTKHAICLKSGILCETPTNIGKFHKTPSQQQCVIQSWLCDHVADCANGEDEEDSICNSTVLLKRSPMSLFEAARQGQNELVLNMLDAGMDVNSRDMYNYTALHYAALHNHHVLVLNLLLHKADLTARTSDGYTALMLATWADGKETALELIRYDEYINAANKDNATALFGVAMRGDVLLANALLRKGALPNVMDIHANTPLLLAVSTCDFEMVRLLIFHGADVNFGSSLLPLHAILVANCTHKQDDVLGLLLQRGADTSARYASDTSGAILHPLELAVLSNKSDLVRTLLNYGTDPSVILTSDSQ